MRYLHIEINFKLNNLEKYVLLFVVLKYYSRLLCQHYFECQLEILIDSIQEKIMKNFQLKNKQICDAANLYCAPNQNWFINFVKKVNHHRALRTNTDNMATPWGFIEVYGLET